MAVVLPIVSFLWLICDKILSQKGKYLIVYSDVGTLCTAVARGATARLNRTSTEKKIMMTLHCDDDD